VRAGLRVRGGRTPRPSLSHQRRHGRKIHRFALVAAVSLFACALQAKDIAKPAPVLVASNAPCTAQEDMFRALKLTKTRRSIRVDYQFIARNEPRWTNMDADLVRRLHVRVGETFCMTRDTGSAEAAGADFD
jgi:hypothetical protein